MIYIASHFLQAMGPALAEQGKEYLDEGKDFGKKNGPAECVAEAMSRDGQCDSFLCNVGSRLFLKSCLAENKVDRELCQDVPERTAIFASVSWMQKVCAFHKHPDPQQCSRILAPVQEYCQREGPSKH